MEALYIAGGILLLIVIGVSAYAGWVYTSTSEEERTAMGIQNEKPA